MATIRKDPEPKPGEFRMFGHIVSPPQTSTPRGVNVRTRHPKVNTAKAPKQKVVACSSSPFQSSSTSTTERL